MPSSSTRNNFSTGGRGTRDGRRGVLTILALNEAFQHLLPMAEVTVMMHVYD